MGVRTIIVHFNFDLLCALSKPTEKKLTLSGIKSVYFTGIQVIILTIMFLEGTSLNNSYTRAIQLHS